MLPIQSRPPRHRLLPRRLLRGSLVLAGLMLGPACSREPAPVAPGSELTGPPLFAISTDSLQLREESLQTLTRQLPERAIDRARKLQSTVEDLLQAPDQQRLQQARRDWQAAIAAYEDFYVFTRLGLISPQNFQALTELDHRLAAWPIQPGYLDRFGPYTAVGLVFDIGLPLNETTLRQQHGLMDDGDVALGFYALEFVLFGERDSRSPEILQAVDSLNAEQRHAGYASTTELPQNRRRQLIGLQTQLIVAELQHLQALWQQRRNSPGAHFAGLSSEQRVTALLRAGLAMLTEQIITLTEQTRRTPDGTEALFPPDRQLAQRLIRQLNGWSLVLQQIDMQPRARLVELTQASLDELQDILDQPLTTVDEDNQAAVIDWRDTYSALSKLASAVRDLT